MTLFEIFVSTFWHSWRFVRREGDDNSSRKAIRTF